MSAALYHLIAIVIIGCILGTMFSFAYPGLAIDNALVLVIALAATVIEGLIVFAFRQISKRR
jgi:uncharacterized membrane protein